MHLSSVVRLSSTIWSLSFRVLILGVALIATRGFVQAADVVQLTSLPVTVAWNKPPGQDVTGYRLYYGLSAGGTTSNLSM